MLHLDLDPATVVVWAFIVAFASDLARVLFELVVNVRSRGRVRPTVALTREQAAVVIPCHNSSATIETTVAALPDGYTVYCIANNCTDNTVDVVRGLQRHRPNIRLIDVDYSGKSKTKAALLGAIRARQDGFTHMLLLDDDVLWPANHSIEVLDELVAVTAVPVIPHPPASLLQRLQIFEYIGANLNKRCQTFFAHDVTWASGAAAIYRCDVFLEVMRLHDGEFAGEDVQCSYLHHYLGYPIDFLPETMVATDVPRTVSEWWRQRAHSWDVSFMFLHLGLLLRVLFRRSGKGPGWWIRLLTFYRIYDSVLVLAKLTLPFAVFYVPWIMALWFATSYLFLALQYLSYPFFFAPVNGGWAPANTRWMAVAFLVFPLYQFMTLASRLAALPRAISLTLRRPPPLGGFIDGNFALCSRVAGD